MNKFKFKVTPASEWRHFREEGELVPLISGRVVRVRPVALDQMILSGELPDFLTAIAAKTLWATPELETALSDQVELAKNYFNLVNLIVKQTVIEPAIVDTNPSESEVLLVDISLQERIEIFNMAQQPAEALRSFRLKQEAGMADIPDGEDIRAATEPVGEDWRPVGGVTVR